jgi:hypothetical protein
VRGKASDLVPGSIRRKAAKVATEFDVLQANLAALEGVNKPYQRTTAGREVRQISVLAARRLQ